MTDRAPQDPLAHHLFTMACNSAWANHRLLEAFATLAPGALGEPRPSYFGSIVATANHLLTVDWFYVDALERAFEGRAPHDAPGEFFEPEYPHAELAPLAEAQRAVDRRLVALCRGLTDAALASTEVVIRRRSGLSRDAAPRLLAHLFQHQIHHRGQLHGLLSHAGVAPPQLDEFFCAGEAEGRAPALAAIGLSEAAVWAR